MVNSSALPSIFTFNCAAAYVYHQLDEPYSSPLIGNLFRDWRQYLAFLADLPGHLSAPVIEAPPKLPLFAASGGGYAVTHHLETEIHWIHAFHGVQPVRERFVTRAARIDWTNVFVSFCEANFGPARLSDDEWSEFASAWNALPYRKLFIGTTDYGRVEGDRYPGRWRERRHYEGYCGETSERCKPWCTGCSMVTWGGFQKEAVEIMRVLGVEDRINPPGPFAPPDKLSRADGRQAAM